MMNKTVMQAYESGSYSTLKKYNSKKNQVSLIHLVKDDWDCRAIMKEFASLKGLEQELKTLNALNDKKIKTVKFYGRNQNVLLYEYINARTLCEFLEEVEPQNEEIVFKNSAFIAQDILLPFTKVIDLLESFHVETGLAFYDINLRNFLLYQDSVVAIDFEDTREEDFSVDFGRFLAFILTYAPSNTKWKKTLVKDLEIYIKANIDVEFESVIRAREKELANIKKRRSGYEKGI
ncbi:hypothetical protein Q5O24_12095 [Eubacteriaceae bacterium ES3]|nr:hypothetical protein Q5O24_12095 [Eubacteriaceae bacterium ES3]